MEIQFNYTHPQLGSQWSYNTMTWPIIRLSKNSLLYKIPDHFSYLSFMHYSFGRPTTPYHINYMKMCACKEFKNNFICLKVNNLITIVHAFQHKYVSLGILQKWETWFFMNSKFDYLWFRYIIWLFWYCSFLFLFWSNMSFSFFQVSKIFHRP